MFQGFSSASVLANVIDLHCALEDETRRAAGLSLRDYAVLRHCGAESHGLTAKRARSLFPADAVDSTAILRGLEKSRLAYQTRDSEDRRARAFHATPYGVAVENVTETAVALRLETRFGAATPFDALAPAITDLFSQLTGLSKTGDAAWDVTRMICFLYAALELAASRIEITLAQCILLFATAAAKRPLAAEDFDALPVRHSTLISCIPLSESQKLITLTPADGRAEDIATSWTYEATAEGLATAARFRDLVESLGFVPCRDDRAEILARLAAVFSFREQ